MNSYYDFDKEHDKDFLREAGKQLVAKVIDLEIKLAQANFQQWLDEQIKSKLTGELLVLKRMIFDSKQEKKDKLKKLKKEKKKKKINLIHNQNENKGDLIKAGSIPELTSVEIEHKLGSECCPHCSASALKDIGLVEESTEFDVNATYYILKRHKRSKYKCSSCHKISTAPGPQKIIEGAQFSTQIAVQVACDKFEHHLPLERQRIKMENSGLKVSVKTLFSITEHLYNLLFELHELNRQDIIEGTYACIDESPMPFYEDEKSSGFVWSLSNDRGAYYQFEPTRSGKVALEMIKGFKGIVMTDGYSGYDFLSSIEGIIHACCWSHVRRYFFNAMSENDHIGIIVDLIDELYGIEHMAQSYADLKYLRETRSLQIFNKIDSWILENDKHFLASTLSGKAITYYINQKCCLIHFLTNEYVPLDNNMAERRQRCPVMGKKNYLSFRSINGADVGMFFYSMIESCKTNGLIPSAYLLEMAHKKLKNEPLQTPYQYALELRKKIQEKLNDELSGLKSTS